MTISAINGITLSTVSAIDGVAKSSLTAINGMTIGGACTTPDCVAGGPALWLEADSLVLSNGDPVSTWADSGAGGNNATAAGTARPTYLTNIINSLPVVSFNGTTNVMDITDVAALELDTDSTVFAVMTPQALGSSNALLSKDSAAASAGAYYLSTDSTGKRILDRPFIEAGVASTSGMSVGTFYLACVKVNSTTVSHYLNTVADGTDTLATGTATSQPLRIAAISTGSLVNFAQMDVAEIIIYDSALSDSDRGIVEVYLNAKYAL